MKLSTGWRADKTRKNRARATRKPKIRWEVLGLPSPLDTSSDDLNGRHPPASVEHGKPWVRPGHSLPHG